MGNWNIEWTQRMGGGTRRFTDAITAETAALALAEWGRRSYCNARVDAVYDAACHRRNMRIEEMRKNGKEST